MYETVKIINGKEIYRMKGTKGIYHIRVNENKYYTFRTIKAATAFCETLK